MKKICFITAVIVSAAVILSSCVNPDTEVPERIAGDGYTVTAAAEYNSLFDRRGIKNAWLGGDGIYSIPVDGNYSTGSGLEEQKDTLFIFSDTIRGSAKKNGKLNSGWSMPNHSAGIFNGKTIDFIFGSNENGNLFIENEWLMDGFSNGKNLYIFSFGHDENWKPEYVRIITVPVSDGEIQWDSFSKSAPSDKLNYVSPDGGFQNVFGAGILPSDDGYLYIYGYRDEINSFSVKSLIAARIETDEFPSLEGIEYYTADGWGKKIENCEPMIAGISCETRVMKLSDGRYITVYTQNTNSAELMYAIACSPCGPFSDPVCFYECPEYGKQPKNGNGTYYTYNAKVHPVLSDNNRILVSYNVNVGGAPAENTADYIPRFLYLEITE